jgi:hypothetical protein
MTGGIAAIRHSKITKSGCSSSPDLPVSLAGSGRPDSGEEYDIAIWPVDSVADRRNIGDDGLEIQGLDRIGVRPSTPRISD